MPYSPTVRAAVLLIATTACGRGHEQHARAAEREQIDDLARQAARLATADSTTADSTTARRSPVGRATIPDRIGRPAIAGLATDSTRITSTDGALVYTLVRDTVRMQLGDSVVSHMRQKVGAGADSASGNFGGFIARTVAGAVGSAVGFVMKTPVRDIRSARYDSGELRIETGGGLVHHGTFSAGAGKHDGDHTTFARADAERFVAAIEARRRALGVR